MLRSILLFIAGLSNVLVGLAVLLRDKRRLVNISFFMLALSMGGWTIGIAGFLLAHQIDIAYFWVKLYYFFPIAAGLALVLFVTAFPDRQKIDWRWALPAFIGFLVVDAPLVAYRSFVTKQIVYEDWGKTVVLNRPEYALYSAVLVVTITAALVAIYRLRRREKGFYASQAELFFVGFVIAYGFGLFFNLILPWWGDYRLVWVGPLFTSFFVVAIAYSIVRHRMFDVRLVIARSIGYLLTITALSFFYGIVAFTLAARVFGSAQPVSSGERFTYLFMALLIALTFRPLRLYFDKLTGRLFYRDVYTTESYISNLNHILVSKVELDDLLSAVGALIEKTLKSGYYSFVINSKEGKRMHNNDDNVGAHMLDAIRKLTIVKPDRKVIVADYLTGLPQDLQTILQRNSVAVVGRIGLENHEEASGFLILGAKKSGNPYNKQDVAVLDATVNELLIAIQNAMRFEQIERFNETLQEKIDDATRKLRRTNDKLRKLDETKDDFISMASHQLRTPLTSVKGYVSMVLDGDGGELTSMQRKLLNQSFISAQRMVYLISDLLNVSRLRTGKFVIEPVPTNLASVVKDEVSQLVETAKGRELELVYNKPEHFPTLMLDDTKMRQVIMNFLDNAIYYTPRGGRITVQLVDKPQSVELTVTDTGIGVPRHEQPHLFSKFFRAHNAKRARPDGTGLGLFMAKKVIIAQGGAIIFKSSEGKGSTFGFTFAKAHLQPSAKPAPTPAQ